MPEQLGIGKSCPNCGTRSTTLGGICPACRRPYSGGGISARTLAIAILLLGVWAWFVISYPVTALIAGTSALAAIALAARRLA